MTIHKALALSALLSVALVRGAAAQCVPACGPCEVCDPDTSTCVVPETLGCQQAPFRASSVTIKKGLVANNDLLLWKWLSSAAVPVEDYGNPLATSDYTLCMHDNLDGVRHLLVSATAPAASHCHGGSCWVQGSFGWRWVDKIANYGGFLKILLKPGIARQAKLFVKAHGVHLELPAPHYTAPVTIRLVRSDGPTCWEANFPVPTRNDSIKFTARSQ